MVQNFRILMLLCLVLISCKAKTPSQEDVPNIKIKGQPILTDYFIYNSHFIGDNLITNKINKDDYAFSVFAYFNDTLVYKMDLARIGQGPGEFENQVYYTNQWNIDSNGDMIFYVYEMNRNKLSKINLTQSLSENKTIIQEQIKVRPGTSFQDVFQLYETTLVSNADNLSLDMQLINFYDINSEDFFKQIPFPNKVKNPIPNDIAYTQQTFNSLYLNILRYFEEKEMLVSAMTAQDIIRVYDLNGNILAEKKLTTDEVLTIENFSKNESSYNVDLELTNDYIYTLYSGEQNTIYYNDSPPTKIRQFDWDLNLIKTYQLDNSINFFTINEDGLVVGVSITEEIIKIYDLNEK